MRFVLAAFGCGVLFGVGLVISGMTQPAKVLGFLDLIGMRSGTWDPTLAFVMAGALAVTTPGFALLRRRARPVLAPASYWPSRSDIDRPLIAGAVLFGLGWGLVGLCPGPAIVNLAALSPRVFVFVIAMAVGMLAIDMWRRSSARRSDARQPARTNPV